MKIDPRLLYLKNRLLGRDTALNFAEQAIVSRTIEPAHTQYRLPAIMLPNMVDRARATMPSSTLEYQKSVALGGTFAMHNTTAYTLRNVCIENTTLFASGFSKPLSWGSSTREWLQGARAQTDRFEQALLVSTHQGITYFGDWLFDNTSRVLLAEQLGLPALSLAGLRPYAHEAHYKTLLNLAYTTTRKAHVDELTVVYEGQSAAKAERYHELRARAQDLPGRRRNHGVYVVRGSTGQMRRLINEEDCIQWAKRRNFSIVDPARMTARDLLIEMKDASCIVGVEGSGLMHGLLTMQTQGFLLGIVAADRFVVGSKEYADALGIRTALVVAGQGSLKGFPVDLSELEDTYNAALSATAAKAS